jgi:hypothetical protein
MKSIRFILMATAALVLVVGTYDQFSTRSLKRQVDRLTEERAALVQYIERLKASRRVAQVNVESQCLNEHGQIVSRLRWQEVRPDGLVNAPVELETVGLLGYFEGFVIKFDHDLVTADDPSRNQSLVVFRRVFGDQQIPDSAPMFDRAPLPGVLEESQGETASLWSRCWNLIEDAELRTLYGVRVAQIEAPAVPLDEGQVWEVSLDAAGGLNLKLIEPGRNFIPPWCAADRGSIAGIP